MIAIDDILITHTDLELIINSNNNYSLDGCRVLQFDCLYFISFACVSFSFSACVFISACNLKNLMTVFIFIFCTFVIIYAIKKLVTSPFAGTVT